MAVPKYKTSKARTASRKAANMKLAMPALSTCGTCGNMITPHRVCPKCGYYKGKQVIDLENMA
jgi:large subunit ribosomal protein L32